MAKNKSAHKEGALSAENFQITEEGEIVVDQAALDALVQATPRRSTQDSANFVIVPGDL